MHDGSGIVRFVIVGLVYLFCTHCLFAQERIFYNDSQHHIGFISGVGIKTGLDVPYDYKVIFYKVQYYYTFWNSKNWSLDLLTQPQFNTTHFAQKTNISREIKGFEVGINLGVLIRKNIFNDMISCYVLISFGPHYLSGTPQRQAKGFNFSDNLFCGLNVRLYKDWYLDFRPGFRHISNAGLADPNGGINSIVLSAGVLKGL